VARFSPTAAIPRLRLPPSSSLGRPCSGPCRRALKRQTLDSWRVELARFK